MSPRKRVRDLGFVDVQHELGIVARDDFRNVCLARMSRRWPVAVVMRASMVTVGSISPFSIRTIVTLCARHATRAPFVTVLL